MRTGASKEAIKRVGAVVSPGEKKPPAPTPLQKDGDRNEISLVHSAVLYSRASACSQYRRIPLYKRCENQPHDRNPNELLVPFKSRVRISPVQCFGVSSRSCPHRGGGKYRFLEMSLNRVCINIIIYVVLYLCMRCTDKLRRTLTPFMKIATLQPFRPKHIIIL